MNTTLTDRLCYASSTTWTHSYVLAVEELMKVDVGDPLAEGAMTTYGQLQEKYENNLAAMEETQLLIDKHNNKARNKLQYVMDTYGPKLDPEATPEDLDYRLPSDIAGILEGIDTFGLETPDIYLSSLDECGDS